MSTATDKKTIPGYTNVRVKVSDIFVNDDDNARKVFDADRLKALAESIKVNGLENPVNLRPATSEDKTNKAYVLVSGFRRMRALKLLEADMVDARVPSEARSRKDVYMAALAENLARDNLSPYETAMAAARGVREYKCSAAELAESTGLSQSHTNNLIRLTHRLPPEILKAWEKGHVLAKIDTLLKIAALESPEAMMTEWERRCTGQESNGHTGAAGAASAAEEGEGGGKGKKAPRRQTMNRLEATLAFLNSKEGKGLKLPQGDEAREWFHTFVRYLAGQRQTPPEGLTLEKPETPKAEKKGKRAKRKKGE